MLRINNNDLLYNLDIQPIELYKDRLYEIPLFDGEVLKIPVPCEGLLESRVIKIEKRGNILQNKSDFDEVFSNIISKNDILMMKGSNAMGLNQIVKQLRRGTNVI